MGQVEGQPAEVGQVALLEMEVLPSSLPSPQHSCYPELQLAPLFSCNS